MTSTIRINVGFVTEGPEAQRIGTKYDVSERASSNQGHEYGVNLSGRGKRCADRVSKNAVSV